MEDFKIGLRVLNITNSQAQASAFALVLQEIDGKRQLPIIIGPAEAQAIAFRLKDIKPPRPLTHDLFSEVLIQCDIFIEEVLIYRAQDGVFFSYLYVNKEGNSIRIDSRTSDAVALAVRFSVPILVYNSILETEGIIPPEEEEPDENADVAGLPMDEMLKQDLPSLKKALENAVKDENYELASVIRDEISRRK